MELRLPSRAHRGFIYDCDGTLVDSMRVHHRAWQEAFRANGARFEFPWALFVQRAGMGLLDTVRELNVQFSDRLDPHRVAADHERNFCELLPSLTAIEPVVSIARAHHGKVIQCVASGGERRWVERELRLVGIRDLFSFVVCRDDVTKGKPDPEMFLLCAERMGLAPSECLVFEDGELGLRAARAAKMAWVAVDGSGRWGDAEESPPG